MMTTRRQLLALSGAALALGSTTQVMAQEATPPVAGTTLTQIRNATLRLDYAGVRFLIDPMLSDRHSWPGFEGTVNSVERNPMVHLPLPIADIIDVDAVIVTHLHPDHWDEAAQSAVPKSLPIFVQNEADAAVITGQGFIDVRILSESSAFNDVNLVKAAGRHGTEAHFEAIGGILGEVCGVVFSAEGQKTVYLAGDTIWNDDVASTLATHRPEVAILNSGYAKIEELEGGIIMGTEDVLSVHKAAPETLLIATNMEAVNHCVLTRAELRAFAEVNGFAELLLTPGDGEQVNI